MTKAWQIQSYIVTYISLIAWYLILSQNLSQLEFWRAKVASDGWKAWNNPCMYSPSLLFVKYLYLPHVLKGTGPDSSGLWQPIVSREKQFHQSCFVALFLNCSVEFGECLGAFLKAWCFEYCFFGPSNFWFGFSLCLLYQLMFLISLDIFPNVGSL